MRGMLGRVVVVIWLLMQLNHTESRETRVMVIVLVLMLRDLHTHTY